MLTAPCFNWVRHNDFSSLMLHGLRAVHERLPGDLRRSLSQAHVFWGKGAEWRGQPEAEAGTAGNKKQNQLCHWWQWHQPVLWLLSGFCPLCCLGLSSNLCVLHSFSCHVSPPQQFSSLFLFHIAKRSFCSYVHMLNISLSSAWFFFFFLKFRFKDI